LYTHTLSPCFVSSCRQTDFVFTLLRRPVSSPDGSEHGGRGGGAAGARDQGVRRGRPRQGVPPGVRRRARGRPTPATSPPPPAPSSARSTSPPRASPSAATHRSPTTGPPPSRPSPCTTRQAKPLLSLYSSSDLVHSAALVQLQFTSLQVQPCLNSDSSGNHPSNDLNCR
jgi:hypothetical protein